VTAEYPISVSEIGSVPGADGFLSPNDVPQAVTELTLDQRSLADSVRARVTQLFTGVDTCKTGTYGYNTYVDRRGNGTRATNFRDGFLFASIERGVISGSPEDVSYGLHQPLLSDPDGYQSIALSYSPQRTDMEVEDSLELAKAAKGLGLQV
jgi:hypothetical protein